MNKVKIQNKLIGDNEPTFILAEIGINHNGNINIAKKLIDVAILTGCDAVKFQKRTPELCVPKEVRNKVKKTIFGVMTYFKYKKRIEFGEKEYSEIDKYCKKMGIMWFASSWDIKSVDFLERFNVPCYKIASACLTDDKLLKHIKTTGKPVIMSTGMSTMAQIKHAVNLLNKENLVLMHCTSSYPSKFNELNLKVIQKLKDEFDVPIGYSGHETGLFPTVASILFGACLAERHITLDRAMPGTDQAASIEPHGLYKMVRDIRLIPTIAGNGKKIVYDSEKPIINKLRRAK